MTIFELQKRLQEMYEKYGDIEVVFEGKDWTGVERYHDEIFKVKNVKYNGSIAVVLANN
nr:MAG TPA: hypothetical protein [Crassvirales sp.]